MQNENEALIVFHNLSFVFTPSHAMMPDWDFYLISFWSNVGGNPKTKRMIVIYMLAVCLRKCKCAKGEFWGKWCANKETLWSMLQFHWPYVTFYIDCVNSIDDLQYVTQQISTLTLESEMHIAQSCEYIWSYPFITHILKILK